MSSNLFPTSQLMNALKWTGGLLLKSMMVMSAVRANVRVTTDSPINVLECQGNYSEGFAEQAMQAFVQAMPHICNESLPLLEDFSPSPVLKNFTLLKFNSGIYSSVDFVTGERKNSKFFALDNNGKEHTIPLPTDERMFVASIHGHEEDVLCGKFMKLKCE